MIVDRNCEVLFAAWMLLLLQEVQIRIECSSFRKPRAHTQRRSPCSARARNSVGPLVGVAPVEPPVSLPVCSLTPRGDTSCPYSLSHCDRDLHGCYRHQFC